MIILILMLCKAESMIYPVFWWADNEVFSGFQWYLKFKTHRLLRNYTFLSKYYEQNIADVEGIHFEILESESKKGWGETICNNFQLALIV